MITLRPYQQDAINAIYKYFMSKDGNPLIVMPTGTGKSIVIDEFIRGAIDNYPNTRILNLVHVRELILQNYMTLMRIWKDAPAGIYSAGLGRRDLHAQILFAGIQSIYKKIDVLDKFDLVLVDEAHLIPRNVDTMYGKFLTALKKKNPKVKIIGFTATPFRLDSGMLHKGDKAMFDDIAYECNIANMIDQGYLTEVIAKVTDTQLDISQVKKRGGEFIAGELERAVDKKETTDLAVEEIIKKGFERGSWLIFCSGVTHAKNVAAAIREYGIDCQTVTGDTPIKERDQILSRFKLGQIRAVTNANVLTTGFDAPGVDLIAMLRPTESTGLHVQMIGRGTRLADGKEDCLVLDFAGNTARHGPLDQLNIKNPGKAGDGEVPIKECPECMSYVHAAVRICPHCEYVFPPPEPKIASHSFDDALLTRQISERQYNVSECNYRIHEKKSNGSKTLRVDYQCGIAQFSQWVCFEHTGFARSKAEQWYKRRMPGQNIPASCAEALQLSSEYPTPKTITVIPEGKYNRITRVSF